MCPHCRYLEVKASGSLHEELLLSAKISKTSLVPLKARAFPGSTLTEWGLKMPEVHKAWKASL